MCKSRTFYELIDRVGAFLSRLAHSFRALLSCLAHSFRALLSCLAHSFHALLTPFAPCSLLSRLAHSFRALLTRHDVNMAAIAISKQECIDERTYWVIVAVLRHVDSILLEFLQRLWAYLPFSCFVDIRMQSSVKA